MGFSWCSVIRLQLYDFPSPSQGAAYYWLSNIHLQYDLNGVQVHFPTARTSSRQWSPRDAQQGRQGRRNKEILQHQSGYTLIDPTLWISCSMVDISAEIRHLLRIFHITQASKRIVYKAENLPHSLLRIHSKGCWSSFSILIALAKCYILLHIFAFSFYWLYFNKPGE